MFNRRFALGALALSALLIVNNYWPIDDANRHFVLEMNLTNPELPAEWCVSMGFETAEECRGHFDRLDDLKKATQSAKIARENPN